MNTVEISFKFVKESIYFQIWKLKTKIYKINMQYWFDSLIYKTQKCNRIQVYMVIFKG